MAQDSASHPGGRQALWAAAVIGFALGGFIDGILLHQVLQWHHLLSLVEGEALRDIRTQILADGLFHVLMYAIAIGGLWLLWRGRRGITGRGSDVRLVAAALLGFGVWQLVDVVGFHWLARIHRIRVDVPNPLVWDVGWLIVFAVPSLAAGWWLWRRAGRGDASGSGPGGGIRAAPVALAALTLVAGPVSALPPRGVTTAVVVFRSGTDAAGAFAAAAKAGARVLWASRSGDVLAIEGGDIGRLYAGGALLVSSSSLIAGCAAWARP